MKLQEIVLVALLFMASSIGFWFGGYRSGKHVADRWYNDNYCSANLKCLEWFESTKTPQNDEKTCNPALGGSCETHTEPKFVTVYLQYTRKGYVYGCDVFFGDEAAEDGLNGGETSHCYIPRGSVITGVAVRVDGIPQPFYVNLDEVDAQKRGK